MAKKVKSKKPVKASSRKPSLLEMRFALEKQVIARKNTNGTYSVMSLNRDDYIFEISGIAADLWGQINGKRSGHQLLEAACKKNGVEAKKHQSKALQFLNTLVKEKLASAK